MQECRDIKELRAYFRKVTSGVSGDTIFMAKASLYSCELLTEMMALMKATNGRKKKRPPSEWNRFFAKGMKGGKAPKTIAAEWRARK